MSINVGPWPWSLLNALVGLITLTAIVTAWKSSDRWQTRTWRILLCALSFGINGIWLPVGAFWVLVQYRGVVAFSRR